MLFSESHVVPIEALHFSRSLQSALNLGVRLDSRQAARRGAGLAARLRRSLGTYSLAKGLSDLTFQHTDGDTTYQAISKNSLMKVLHVLSSSFGQSTMWIVQGLLSAAESDRGVAKLS
jgi:hypothetical protein